MSRKAPEMALDDEIPEDALSAIPDLPDAEAQGVDAEEFVAIIAELRAGMQAAFAREMDNVERSVLAGLRDVQERLASAESENERLVATNDQLLRKVEGLKQLTRAIEQL
ncbi:MAG: hypothetical protein QOE90_1591 [Thermoplasmata archaeon]|jgi:hypothetical protein|nr:hypothetical protein [Thermoplasmata archaeon]